MKLKLAIAAMFALVIFGHSAHAQGIKNCGNLFFWVADECLYQNDSKLKSHSSSLRKEIAKLKLAVSGLTKDVADLKKQIAGIRPPDLSGYVTYNSKIQLRATGWDTPICLDSDTHSASHVQGWTCNTTGAQDWEVRKR